MHTETTVEGTRFCVLGDRRATPAPLLLLLAMDAEQTLTTLPYARLGQILAERGCMIVSLDLPCHGLDRRTGEPEQLAGWAARLAQGEDIAAPFCARVGQVIEHLIDTGVAASERIASAGTSRGGFMAFQAAAANARIRAVAGFAPVTDLGALTEFAGQTGNPVVARLGLTNAVPRLADRAAWITIGGRDERVGTDRTVAFAETLRRAAAAQGLAPRVILNVVDTPGHASFVEWHERAAEWLMEPGVWGK